MVKAKTKALNILLPEDLAIWLDGYATEKTKTKIICELLEGLRKNGANPVGNPDVDNSVDGIESIVKAYLDKHLQSYIEKCMGDMRVNAIDNPVEDPVVADVDVDVEDSVVTDVVADVDVEKHVETDVDEYVVTVDVVSESLPVIDAIAATAKPKATKRSAKSQPILTRHEALAIAQSFNQKVTGQNLYDWAKSALNAKSDESRLANSEKLSAVGLVAVFSPENKPAWTAKA